MNKNLLRIMSFNIRYYNTIDGANHWDGRKEMAASMIRFHLADIACLQEATKKQMDDLESLLPDYGWIGVGRKDGESQGEYAPIFYRKDSFSPIWSKTLWLCENPENIGEKGWDSSQERIVTFAKFFDRGSGQEFFIFNTHFDNKGAVARKHSAWLLADIVGRYGGTSACAVTGDLNCTEDSETYKILAGSHGLNERVEATPLRDAFHASRNQHHGPVTTFHDFGRMKEEIKIDYIFVNNAFSVVNHGILAEQWNGRYPSDHYPVVADLTME